MQGMATEQSCGSTAGSTNQPVLFKSFYCKFGAGWRKTASRRHPWRNDPLVAADQANCEVAHGSSHMATPRRVNSSERKSLKGCSRADCLGFITQSKPRGMADSD